MTKNKHESVDWYDYPQYFDMLFSDETADEVKFFKKAFEKFSKRKVNRVLEPGCGSGRLVVAMAKQGYDVTGLDLSPAMLNFLDQELGRKGLKAKTVLGDMTQMKFKKKFDAAFCTFNTFRHLLDEKSAVKHLRNVADQVRKGGLYILGFHIIPMDADPDCIERWHAKNKAVEVNAKLKVIDFKRKKRLEKLRVTINAKKASGKTDRLKTEFALRVYTHKQARKTLQSVSDVWEIASIFDFDYDIEEPRDFDKDLTDALFVLRRK
ncbi:Glycine/sarcosine N-methyltransferase [Rubripirellula obstinata]|uniref:Glycine/sarcosine N-methyltransferase n=1 Tax=Rubripirellula obstinata TaxID=406547 RepID=A0A5B1CP63_9BACT|nr:class I SAM-dependent methyltransferase [Rubripirellula obstinata]KAA1261639.1 Glycine/sarcosine N-methyltransferase [Rubripirellula obstinata]